MNTADGFVQTQLLSVKDVCNIIKQARSSIYLKINRRSKYFDNSFPLPIRIGKKAIRWKMADINAWIEQLDTRKNNNVLPAQESRAK